MRAIICVPGLVVVCLAVVLRFVRAEDEASANRAPWLWPPPQKIEVLPGSMPVRAVSVLIPDTAGERVTAIAKALCKYVNFYHKGAITVTRVKGAAELPYALVLARAKDASAYKKLSASVSIEAIPKQLPDRRVWRRESYVLRIAPEGAAIVAPEIWGLLQGTRTFMQLARAAAKAGRDVLPAVSITDWPDIPEHVFLAVQPAAYVREGKQKSATAMIAELKYNHMMFALYDGGMSYPLHPELKAACPPHSMLEWADYARSLGLPTWPWIVSAASGPHYIGSIVYYPDTEEFYQVKFEMMDHALEVLRPDAFHICMSEQYLAKKRWNGWMRSKEEYIANLVRHCNFCLRRGVTPSIWGDNFAIAANFHPREQILKTDPEAVRRIPRELIIIPWNYANKVRYEYPWETLASEDFGFRVMNGCAWWGTDGSFHAQHMTRYGKELPLMWGLVAVIWGGPGGGKPAVNRCAGSLWNCRLGVEPKEVEARNKLIMEAAPYDVQAPDFLEPLGLEAMLWRAPKGPVSEHVKMLEDTDFLVWEEAREELVAFSAGGAAEILQAMAESPPVEPDGVYEGLNRPLRWKLEGVLSRICRDGRHGEARGELAVKGVQKYLGDSCRYVRDMAAELIASCAPKQEALPIILEGLKKEKSCCSCVRAVGIAGLTEAGKDLVALVSNERASLDSRVAAARYLVYLKPREAGRPLLAALQAAEDVGLKKELIRTLSLVSVKGAEEEIARHLEKEHDKFARIRALIALVNMKSAKAGSVESWLAEDDRAIVEMGCWALGRVHGEEAVKIIERNIGNQKNETLKEALKYQSEKKLFLRW